jgi:Putative transposase.
MVEVQDIFRGNIYAYRQKHALSLDQAKAVKALLSCRTSALGAHVDACDECEFERISYNSCRNRHCPKCQAFAKEQWIEKRQNNLMNTQYFHAVFTVPDDLNSVFYQNQRQLYGLFFKAVSETLMELCADKKYLGATPGITAVLHTRGQNLCYHPHLHCIVTGGGLADGNRWVSSRKKFFIPVKVLSRKFRGKFLCFLKKEGLALDDNLYRKEWVVYCKKPFGNAGQVISYLGRYTHRVAISNNRITAFENGRVSFKYKDYKDAGRTKSMSLSANEFMRRFLMHVLPRGFWKIRHYGLFASRNKIKKLALCKKLTHTKTGINKKIPALEKLSAILGEDFNLCPRCKVGHLIRDAPTSSA